MGFEVKKLLKLRRERDDFIRFIYSLDRRLTNRQITSFEKEFLIKGITHGSTAKSYMYRLNAQIQELELKAPLNIKPKPKISKHIIASALFLLSFLGIFFLFTDPTLTGLITYSNEAEYVLDINSTFNISTEYALDFSSLTNNTNNITSVRLSGQYVGDVKVYLEYMIDNVSVRKLIYTGTSPTESSNLITGMVTGDVITEVNETPIVEELVVEEPLIEAPVEDNQTEIIIEPEIINETINETVNESIIDDEIINDTVIIENVTENITQNITENVTANITEELIENITTNITENITSEIENITQNITVLTNQTEPTIIAPVINETIDVEIVEPEINQTTVTLPVNYILFTDECLETCNIDIPSDARLIIEVGSDSSLVLDSLSFTQKLVNRPPEQIMLIGNVYLENLTVINLSNYFSDPDNDELLFDVSFIPGVNATVEGELLFLSFIDLPLNASGFVYVTDGKEMILSDAFNIVTGVLDINTAKIAPELLSLLESGQDVRIIVKTNGQLKTVYVASTVNDKKGVVSGLGVQSDVSSENINSNDLKKYKFAEKLSDKELKNFEGKKLLDKDTSSPVEISQESDGIISSVSDLSQVAELSLMPEVDYIMIDSPYSALTTETISLTGINDVLDLGYSGSGVKVCVLDTGYNGLSSGYNFVDNNDNYSDVNGHGTNVVYSLISSAPEINLIIVKVIDDTGNGYASDIIAGLDYCLVQNASIVSLSIGGGSSNGYCDSDLVAQKVNELNDNGVLVVAATGNDGSDAIKIPSCASGALPVGASTKSFNIATFSNFNNATLLVAPGENIVTKDISGNDVSVSGTSMSVPFVSGTAALLLENESSLDSLSLKDLLVHTGDVINYSSRQFAQLNAWNALTRNITNNLSVGGLNIGYNISNFTTLAIDAVTLINPTDENTSITSPVFFLNNVSGSGIVNATLYTNETGWAAKETRWNGEINYNDTDLLLLYHFNNESGENGTYVYDWSGHGNNATASSPAPDYNASGKFGATYDFVASPSVDKYFTLSDNDYFTNLTEMTVMAWIKPFRNQSNISGSGDVISKRGNGTITWNMFYIRIGTTNRVEFLLTNETSTSQANGGDNAVLEGQWTHIVGRYNGTNIDTFVNGVEDTIAAYPFTGTLHDTTVGFYIAYYGSNYNGSIDEVAIWNRSLSNTEVLALYNYSRTKFYPVFQNRTLSNGTYIWNVMAYDNQSNSAWASSNFTFTIGISPIPVVTLLSPANGVNSNSPITFISTATDNQEVINATLYTNESGTFLPRETRWNGEIAWNSTGLVGLWHFNNESALGENDSVVYDSFKLLNGSFIGGNYTGANGKFGRSAMFDGINDYVDAGGVIHDADNDNITISVWINPQNLDTDLGIVGERGNPDSTSGWSMRLMGTVANDPIMFTLYAIVDQQSNPSYISANEWTNIVVTYDRQYIRFYINGTLLSSHGRSASIIPATRNLYIGAINNIGTPTNYFNGSIDEVAIWNRSLSNTEVLALYNYSRTSFYPVFQKRELNASTYVWNVLVYDNQSNSAWAASNFTFNATTYPNIYLLSPGNGASINTSAFLLSKITDNQEVINATLYTNESGTWLSRETRWPGEIMQNDTSLYALYHFNNESAYGENGTVIYDFSGNGRNGVCTTCPTLNTTNFIGPSMRYNTSGAGYSVGSGTDFEFYNNFTIAFWINFDNASGFHDIFKKSGMYAVFFDSGQIYLQRNLAPWSSTNTIGYPANKNNTWQHVVITRNASNTTTIYLDGVVKRTGTFTIPSNPTGAVSIGRSTGSRFIHGRLDELAVWSRELYLEEVVALYNFSKSQFYPLFQERILANGTYIWNVLAVDNESNINWGVNNFTFIVNAPPPITISANISPVLAYKTSTLMGYCNGTMGGTGSDYPIRYYYQWYVNTVANASGSVTSTSGTEVNVANISSSLLTKGQSWILSCKTEYLTLNSTWLNSTTTSVLNSVPTVTGRIAPTTAYNDTNLTGYCTGSDADSDNLIYYYKWFKDGVLNSSGNTSALAPAIERNVANVSSSITSRFETWTLECKADDGAANSTAVNNSRTILNYIPVVSSVTLTSSTGYNVYSDNLTVTFTQSDGDSDPVYNNTDWRRNGTSIAVLNLPFNKNVSVNTTGAVKDYSTYGNNGTLGGGVSANAPTWTGSGKIGGGYVFNKSGNEYIKLEDSPLWDFSGPFTISAFIKTSSNPSGLTGIVTRDTSSPYVWYLRFGGYLEFGMNNDPVTYVWTPTIGTWYHVAAVWNGTHKILYVNGINVSEELNSTAPQANSDPVYIGMDYIPGQGRTFNGSIDEVQIFKQALSSDQIYAIYQAGLNNKSFDTLVSQETVVGDQWTVAVTPSDGYDDGTTQTSNSIYILSDPIYVSLIEPFNGNSSVLSPVFFVSNATDDQEVINATLYTNESGTFSPIETRWNGEVAWNSSGLVGLWHFNNETGENQSYIVDWARKTHNATCDYASGECGNLNLSGLFGKSIDVENDVFEIPAHPDFNLGEHTISAWVYVNELPSVLGRDLTVIRKIDISGPIYDSYSISITSAETSWCDKIIYTTRNSSGSYFGTVSDQNLTVGNLLDKWIHVVGRLNSSNRTNLFINGVKQSDSDNILTHPYVSDDQLLIGASTTGLGSAFNGSIDEVAIWNRSLSDTEVIALYNYSRSKFYPVFQSRNYTPLTAITWNVLAVDNASNSIFAPNNFTFTVTYTLEEGVNLLRPENGTSTDSPVFFVSAANLNNTVVNATLYTNESGWAAKETRWTGEIPYNSTALRLLVHFNNESEFGENDTLVYDFSGNGITGTANGTPVFNNTGGKFGGAFMYTGFNNFDFGYNLDMQEHQGMTIMAWVNALGWTKSSAGIIEKFGHLGNYYMISSTSGVISFRMLNLTDDGASQGISTTSGISAGQWYHLAASYDDINTTKIYVNGVLNNSNNTLTMVRGYGNARTFKIGYNYNNNAYFNGTIDEVAVFNRTLSDEEIAAIYAYTSPQFSPVFQNRTLDSGTYVWNVLAIDNESNTLFAPYNFTFTIDNSPTVNLITPLNGLGITSPVFFVSNASDDQEVINMTLYTNESGTFAPRETRWNGEIGWNDTGLIALWHFNNESAFGENTTTVFDWSGNEHNATLVGSRSFVDGKFSLSTNSSGTSTNYFRVNHTSALNISGRAMTVSLWVRPNSVQVVNWARFIDKEYEYSYFFGTGGSGGSDLSFWLNDTSVVDTASVLVNDVWQHVAVTYNSTNASIYYNGVNVGNGSYNGEIIGSTSNLHIGCRSPTTGSCFNGSMDELAIWNRSLSATEILALYNYTKNSFYPVFQNRTFGDGTYVWNVLTIDNQSQSSWASSNFTFTIGGVPVVTLISPSGTTTSPVVFLSNASDNQEVINATLYTNESGTFAVKETRWNGEVAYNSTGLVALYHFNNESGFGESSTNIYDWSMLGNNGTWVDNAHSDSGIIGKSASLDGSGDYITLTTNPITNMSVNNSMCAWVLTIDTDVSSGGYSQTFANVYNDSSNTFRAGNNLGNFFVSYTVGGSAIGQVTTATVFNNNVWSFVCYTYNGTTLQLYSNGVSMESTTNTYSTGTTNIIGSRITTAGYWYGNIDELSLWNRSLSATEILALYNYSRLNYYPVFQNRTLSNGTYIWNVLSYDNQSQSAWASSNYTFTINSYSITVNLTSPPTNWFTNIRPILECSASSTASIVNVTLYTNASGSWTANQTNSTVSGTTVNVLFNGTTFPVGNYTWNCYACNEQTCAFDTSNRTFYVDTTNPLISFVGQTPADGEKRSNTSNYAYINVSSSDDNGQHAVVVDWNRSLVGWWTFDNVFGTTVYDKSSYGNNGTAIGGAYQSEGYFGKGMTFDGINDYVLLDNTLNTTDFTIIFWYKTLNTATVMGHATEGNSLLTVYTSGTIRVRTTTGNPEICDFTGNTPNVGNWNHLTLTKNSTSMRAYMNGIESTFGVCTNNGDLVLNIIGRYQAGSYTNGTVDEVAYYARALSPAEINASYNANLFKYYNNFTNLSGGTYPYTAYVVDRAGNMNETSRTLTIDMNNPNTTLTHPYNDTYSKFPSQRFQSSTTDDVEVLNATLYTNESGWSAKETRWNGEIAWNDTGLQLLWRFDNSSTIASNLTYIYDWSGKDNVGKCGATCAESSSLLPGKFGLSLNHSTNFNDRGIYSNSNITNSGNWTFSYWLKTNDTSQSYDKILSGGYYYTEFLTTWGQVRCRIYNGSVWTASTATPILQNNTWYMITGKYNGTHGVLYLDGQLVSAQTLSGTVTQSSNNISILYTSMHAILDEVAIWNRSLSDEEVAALYNYTKTSFLPVFQNRTLAVGKYVWNVLSYDAAGNLDWGDNNFTLTIDQTNPLISFVGQTPTDGEKRSNTSNWAYINVSSSDDQGQHAVVVDWNRSLVGWWTFDNVSGTTVYDKSSYGNNGTTSGGAYQTEGYYGKGMHFDGTSTYATFPKIPANNFTGNDSFTVSVWVRPDMNLNDTTEDVDIIFEDYYWKNITSTHGFRIYWDGINGGWTIRIQNGTASRVARDTSSGIANAGQWYYLSAIYNVTHVRIYVGGALKFTNSVPGGMSREFQNDYYTIGSNYLFSGERWNGTIDELQIYSRALTDIEINASYNANLFKYYNNFTNLPGGTYPYTAYVVDRAGNVNSTSRSFTLDLNDPTTTLTHPYNDTYSNVLSQVFQSTITDDVEVLNATLYTNESGWSAKETRWNGEIAWNDTGLVGLWHFNNETAFGENSTKVYDFSGKGNNGTITNAIYNSSGKFGGGYEFDGSGDYIIVANAAVLNSSNVITISAWVYALDNDTIAREIVSKNGMWRLQTLSSVSNNYPIFFVNYNSTGSVSAEFYSGMSKNAWHHVVGTYNGTTAFIYVDGVSSSENAPIYGINSNANNIFIGSNPWGSGNYFNGTLDEVTIWNKYMNSTEVLALYNYTKTSFQPVFQNRSLSVGKYVWNVLSYDAAGNLDWGNNNFTLTIDQTNPLISFVSPTPTDGEKRSNTSNYAYINVSSSDDNGQHTVVVDWNRSLVGWWTFDNVTGSTVYDKSSYGNNGTTSGGAYQTEGYYGKGMYFDGAGDYVDAGNSSNQNFRGQITAEAWVKFDSWKTDDSNVIVAKGRGVDDWILMQTWTYIRFRIYNNWGVVADANYYIGSMNATQWNHIVGTYDTYGDAKARLYINSINVYTGSANASYNYDDSKSVRVGASTDNDNYFNGTIDEVKIWNRALSPIEINASYNANLFKYYNNFTNLPGGNYTYKAYAIDRAGNENATALQSFIINSIPAVSNVILNATTANNYSSDNLTLFFTQSDADGDAVYNVTDWRKNGQSIAVLNMPFNTNVSSTATGAVLDYSTYGNNGTLGEGTSSYMPIWNSSGRNGGSYEFDGTKYISVPDSESLRGMNGVGVSFWTKINQWTYNSELTTYGASFISKGEAGGYLVEVDAGTSSKVATNFRIAGFGGWGSLSYPLTAADNTTFLSNWTHVYAFINESYAELWFNGVLKKNTTFSGTAPTSFTTLYIGRRNTLAHSLNLTGSIDELQILNRSLSPDQIQAIYQAGLANHSVDIIVRNETQVGENWSSCITASDSIQDSSTVCSNNVTIINTPPIVSNVKLNATSVINSSSDNLTLFYSQSDADGDTLSNVTDWRKNGQSIAVLNMPFNTNVSVNTSGAVKDYSTFGNNGTSGGGTTGYAPIWNASGKIGGAYVFDAIDDYVDTNVDLSWVTTDSFSMSAWVKNTVADNHINSIVSKVSWEYTFYTRNTNIGFNYWNSGGSDTITMQGSVGDITNWHFAVVTYNGSVGKLYIDGILSSTDDVVSGTLQNRAETIKIGTGYAWGTSSGNFNGTIDEVQIFNRSLSPEQIQAIYQAGLANHSVDIIVRNETVVGENWTSCVTASDSIQDSATVCSNNVTIVNNIPSLTAITVAPSCVKNGTVTVTTSGASDSDGDPLSFSVGSSSGASNLCTQAAGSPERSCGFTVQSFWTDTASHTLYGRVNDGLDNSTERSVAITTDNSAPSIPVQSSPANESYLSDSTPDLTWSASTDVGCNATVSQYNVTIYTDASCSAVQQSSLTASLTYTATTLGDGTYYWNVKAKDGFGTWSSTSTCWKFIVSTANTIVGSATSWNWSTITNGTIIIRSGNSTNWTWTTHTPSSGRKIVNGTATSWSWVNE